MTKIFIKKLCSNDFFQINYIGKTLNFCATYLFELMILKPGIIDISFTDIDHDILRLFIIDKSGRVVKSFNKKGLDNINYTHTKCKVNPGLYLIKYWTNSGTDEYYNINIGMSEDDMIDNRSNHSDRRYHYGNNIPRISPFDNYIDKQKSCGISVDHNNKLNHFRSINKFR